MHEADTLELIEEVIEEVGDNSELELREVVFPMLKALSLDQIL